MNILFSLLLSSILFAKEKPLTIPEHILQVRTKVVSSPSTGKTSYRAIVISEGAEGGYRLTLEKFKRGEEGAGTTVLMTQESPISKISGFKEFLSKFSSQSQESIYGCCEPVNLVWNENNEFHFEIFYKERKFKKYTTMAKDKKVELMEEVGAELNHFHCESSSLDQYKVELKCRKL